MVAKHLENFIFITGMLRSGTTLMQKLLSMQSSIDIQYQPNSPMYVDLKKRYLSMIGAQGYPISNHQHDYPLNDLFGENFTDPSGFTHYLETTNFLRNSLTPDTLGDGNLKMSLLEFLQDYGSISAAKNYYGCKENTTEEFADYLIRHGSNLIFMVRDPRDVIASLNFGVGSTYGGVPKPLLFNIRQWRKSVAFAMEYATSSNLIRYEDLVTQPAQTLNLIMKKLQLPELPEHRLDGPIQTKNGKIWNSNSSHSESPYITTKSIGQHHRMLSDEQRQLIQACCYVELIALGYEVTITPADVVEILENTNDDTPLMRRELDAFGFTGRTRNEELGRWESLRSKNFKYGYFISNKSFAKLSILAAEL